MEPLTLIAQARAAGLELNAVGDRLVVRGPLSAEPLVVQLRRHKPEVLALLAAGDAEVVWRVAAFRARLPARGPIWPPRLRAIPTCDASGYCSLCGDELPVERLTSPWRRCRACVCALGVALCEVREGTGPSFA